MFRNELVIFIKSFVSEPGYYEHGSFGIRIESIIQVIQAPDTETYFNGKGALKFMDITMAPIQTKLIDVKLLTTAEVNDFSL